MISEIITVVGGFIAGIVTDKLLKKGSTKIINQQVCFYYPFAFQGRPSQISRVELQLQFVNSSGNPSFITDFFLQIKLGEPHDITFGFPFLRELPPAITVREKSSETVKLDISWNLNLTHSELMLQDAIFILRYKVNGKEKTVEFTEYSMIEEGGFVTG